MKTKLQNGNLTPQLPFSEKYDETKARDYFDKHQNGFWRRLSNWREQAVARKALALAGNPTSVLDVPCGTGRFWPLLAENKDREIIACDYSQAMIDIGLQRRDQDVTKRIKTFRSSAFELELDDEAVENIFCIRFFHHLGNRTHRLRVLKEFHRVTRSTLILSLWVDGNLKAWRRRQLEKTRPPRQYQNRYVVPRAVIEQEFESANFEVIGALDFLPRYAMWRTYILKKR